MTEQTVVDALLIALGEPSTATTATTKAGGTSAATAGTVLADLVGNWEVLVGLQYGKQSDRVGGIRSLSEYEISIRPDGKGKLARNDVSAACPTVEKERAVINPDSTTNAITGTIQVTPEGASSSEEQCRATTMPMTGRVEKADQFRLCWDHGESCVIFQRSKTN